MMIRVLHMIGSLDIGGSQTMIMSIYRKIDREKIQFDFILDHPDQLFFAEEVKRLGGKIYSLPSFKGTNVQEIKKAWNKFFDEHQEYKILHSHVRSYASLYIPIAKKKGVYTIIHSHSTSNGKGVAAIMKSVLQYPLRWQADFYMACSNVAGEWLFGKKIIKKKNYKVIPNAIDSHRFDYSETVRKKLRDKLGIRNKTVIGHVGRMTMPKNHLFLLNVFEEYLKFNEDAILLLVGDGDLRISIEEEVKRKNLEEKVLLVGNKHNTYDYYQVMDLFVFPSLWEGLGIAVIEAQTSGLPCVVSERIPREVDLGLGLINVVTLEQGVAKWADTIRKCKFSSRTGHASEVIIAGYDVLSNTCFLEKFYEQIDKNMRM